MVKVRINGRVYSLSWGEFTRFVLQRSLGAPVEILSAG